MRALFPSPSQTPSSTSLLAVRRMQPMMRISRDEQHAVGEIEANVSEQVAIENLKIFRLTGEASATLPPPENTTENTTENMTENMTVSDSALLA
ncbi:hypothetical protein PGQ11_007820 [Apiospora arundinis]|uniref:Uncharacterized protein n=1 Tax=Apiospora arundinis TaxID=335852 RepID=A0ABR2IWU9_9PEZI